MRSPWCRPLSGCSPSAAIDGPVVPSLHTCQLLPPVVALGKFDALHKGHRALAAAAAALGGAPWLVSFSGIAEVLGWPARLPLVAPCDRRRVLASWAQHCQGRVPQECAVPFAEVGWEAYGEREGAATCDTVLARAFAVVFTLLPGRPICSFCAGTDDEPRCICRAAGNRAAGGCGAALNVPSWACVVACNVNKYVCGCWQLFIRCPCCAVHATVSYRPWHMSETAHAAPQVAGVVVGSNYRFGYRAAGTASLLRSLGPQHGLQVQVLDLVAGTPDANGSAGGSSSSGATAAHKPAAGQAAAPATLEQQQQQQPGPQQQQHGGQLHGQGLHAAERAAAHEAASSSRVRHALAHGDMADAALCLDRPYRLVASMADDPTSTMLTDGAALRLPTSSLCNQPPRPGTYEVVAMLAGAETLQELGTPRHVQLSLDETGLSLHGCGDWASALPPGAAHVSLDFL